MNTQNLLSANHVTVQARSLRNGFNGFNGGKKIVHLRRAAGSSICGVDFHYFRADATSKVAETSCKNCLRVHEANLARRRLVSARSAVVIKQPANLKPGGLVAMEEALQRAVAAVEIEEQNRG
jgi:hypothetical protein